MASQSPDSPAAPAEPTPSAAETKRRIVFVVGSGRSGTSTMSGTLQALGMHVPQPEVSADATNPKGFGEPQWIVEFHERLMARSRVQTADARPQAWFEAGQFATRENVRNELFDYLTDQFAEAAPTEELVIKDPRLVWFLGLWRSAAIRTRAKPVYVTMLRPPTEVVGSKQKYYAGKQGEISRTAGWVNVMLGTERATRDAARAFVRYHDMLTDWTVPVFALGESLDLSAVQRASAQDLRKVHSFIDPSLRRVQLTWDDVTVPQRLREIAEETWEALNKQADPGGDTADVHATLDQLREAYDAFYVEAEAVAMSTAVAARAEGLAAPRPAPPERDALGRLPHGVRAMVPAGARRRVRQALENRKSGD